MSKMNLVVDLKGYDGTNANTCQASFKRNAQYVGIDLNNETVQEVTVAGSGGTATLFDAPGDARKFIYLETTAECGIAVNDIVESNVKPIVIGTSSQRGIYLKSSDIEKVVITNNNVDEIKIYYITSK
jgi:hypothetical protein